MSAPASRWRIILPFVVLLVGAAGFVALKNGRQRPERQAPPAAVPMVRALAIAPATASLDVISHGQVAPRTETALVAQVAGVLEEVSDGLADGAAFRKGQVLAVIDPRDYEIAVTAAEATVAQTEVQLALEQSQSELARQDWEELGEGEASPLVLRQPQLAGARATRDGARAALRKARLNLERTRLRAPFDGRVRQKAVDVGQFVGPGTPIAQIFATDVLEVRLPLSVDELSYLDLSTTEVPEFGPAVRLEGDLGGQVRQWSGRVVRTAAAIDPATRTLSVVVEVDPSDAPPPVGLFITATIEGRSVADVVRIPRSALLDDGRLLLVDDENQLRFQEVTVLRLTQDFAIVADSLNGRRVCTAPVPMAIDGMKVRLESTP